MTTPDSVQRNGEPAIPENDPLLEPAYPPDYSDGEVPPDLDDALLRHSATLSFAGFTEAARFQSRQSRAALSGRPDDYGLRMQAIRACRSPDGPRLDYLLLDEAENLPPSEPLISGILNRASISLLFGKPATMKSFLALDMCLSLASGIPWLGFPTQRARTIYITTEGLRGLPKRIEAWKLSHRNPSGEPLDPSPCLFVPTPVPLNTETGQALLHGMLADVYPFKPDLLIVDTMNTCTPGMDENSAQEVGEFLKSLYWLRSHGCAVLLVHHSRKGSNEFRGSTTLAGAADTMISVRRRGEVLTLRCEKQKDEEPFPDFSVDAFPSGASLALRNSAALPEPTEAPSAEDTDQRIRAILLAAGGTLAYSDWLAQSGLAPATFNRARVRLKARGLITQIGRGVWSTPTEAVG